MNTVKCQHCGRQITWQMAKFSMSQYKKELCLDGQIEEIRKVYPPKLQEFTINTLRKKFGKALINSSM